MTMDFGALMRPNELGKGPRFQSKTIERKMKAGVDIMDELEAAIFPSMGPAGKEAWPQVLLFRRGRRNGTVSRLCGFGYERVDMDTEDDRVIFTFRVAATGLKPYLYENGRFEFLEPIPYICSLFECGPFITPSKGSGRSSSPTTRPASRGAASSKQFAKAA